MGPGALITSLSRPASLRLPNPVLFLLFFFAVRMTFIFCNRKWKRAGKRRGQDHSVSRSGSEDFVSPHQKLQVLGGSKLILLLVQATVRWLFRACC